MWTHRFEQACDVPPDRLWPVLADVARWPEVDRNIECLRIDGPPRPGVPFRLKLRGGPVLRFTIG